MSEVDTLIEVVREDIAEIKEDIKAIKGSLHGNGKKGLVTRVELLEHRVNSSASKFWDIAKVVGAALLACIGTLIVKGS